MCSCRGLIYSAQIHVFICLLREDSRSFECRINYILSWSSSDSEAAVRMSLFKIKLVNTGYNMRVVLPGMEFMNEVISLAPNKSCQTVSFNCWWEVCSRYIISGCNKCLNSLVNNNNNNNNNNVFAQSRWFHSQLFLFFLCNGILLTDSLLWNIEWIEK